MADSKAPSQPQAGSPAAASNPPPSKSRNPVFRMMGLPSLPKKLPSRNWMIFWGVTAAFTTAIVYDKREKNRATAKWRKVVAPLATEPIGSANQLPRKLTIYLESHPGDGLRTAQDHFIEYAKPVLAASGLDWEFVQGRMQGDVRAAVAERIRRSRRAVERPGEEAEQTDEAIVQNLRKRMGCPEYEGVEGDIILGRHTWKEYIRGLHEGWLGSLDAPPAPVFEVPEAPKPEDTEPTGDKPEGETKPEEEKKEEKRPERPPQPVPHNSVEDYPGAVLPAQIPAEFNPSMIIAFPHRLGFTQTFVRLGRFLNRRKLADQIGRDVAAVCYAASRDYREADGQFEQELLLLQEEKDWPKSVWKVEEEEKEPAEGSDDAKPQAEFKKERVWTNPIVGDPRIMHRMRRFELRESEEQKARVTVVPEEEIEGWIKGSFRSLFRWGAGAFKTSQKGPNVGNLDDE